MHICWTAGNCSIKKRIKEEKLLNLCNGCEIGNRLRQLSFTPNSFLRSWFSFSNCNHKSLHTSLDYIYLRGAPYKHNNDSSWKWYYEQKIQFMMQYPILQLSTRNSQLLYKSESTSFLSHNKSSTTLQLGINSHWNSVGTPPSQGGPLFIKAGLSLLLNGPWPRQGLHFKNNSTLATLIFVQFAWCRVNSWWLWLMTFLEIVRKEILGWYRTFPSISIPILTWWRKCMAYIYYFSSFDL